jgi:hypothetical protein
MRRGNIVYSISLVQTKLNLSLVCRLCYCSPPNQSAKHSSANLVTRPGCAQYAWQYILTFLKVQAREKVCQIITVARLFRTFPAKVAGKFEKIQPLKKCCVKHPFRHLLEQKTIHKNRGNFKHLYGFSSK